MAFWLIAKGIYDLANEILEETDIDTDKDGDVDTQDIENLIERGEMFASILGLVSQVDDEVSEVEEEQAWDLLEKICFSTILTDKVLEVAQIKKKDVKKRIMQKFADPSSSKKIAKYAIEKELEEKFYELSCLITVADNKITEEEREFLDEFGKALELSKFDIKGIERKYLKLVE